MASFIIRAFCAPEGVIRNTVKAPEWLPRAGTVYGGARQTAGCLVELIRTGWFDDQAQPAPAAQPHVVGWSVLSCWVLALCPGIEDEAAYPTGKKSRHAELNIVAMKRIPELVPA